MNTTYHTSLRKNERSEDAIGDALGLFVANVLYLAIDSFATHLKQEIRKSLYSNEGI